MMPALLAFERTGEPRWREVFVACAEHLLATWEYHADAYLWTQDLYGERVRLLGAAHGFAGNVYPLLRGAALLTDAQRAAVHTRAAHTLAATALRDPGDAAIANWSPHVGSPRAGREKILVQWCHGAPGMILALARLPRTADTDSLLASGGELTWRAGPLAKGAGLCHGTAGNGSALLALHLRTGDPRWLDRARLFAMHALAQVRAADQPRYSLFTGDVGVALFLAACVEPTALAAELPGVAYF